MEYILIAICVLEFFALLWAFHRLQKAGRTLNEYEQFHLKAVEQVRDMLSYMHRVVNDYVVLQGDTTVQQVMRMMKKLYELLVSYFGAFPQPNNKIPKESTYDQP